MSLWYMLGYSSIIVGTIAVIVFILMIAWLTIKQSTHKMQKELEKMKFNIQMDQIEAIKKYELATRKQFNHQEQ